MWYTKYLIKSEKTNKVYIDMDDMVENVNYPRLSSWYFILFFESQNGKNY